MKKEKKMDKEKKMSKKKKIVVITLSVIAALLFILITVALILAYNLWYKTPDRKPIKTAQQVTLIAHRGYNCLAPENTAPAFEKAGEYGFWGAECDIYRTADGVWVITHDVNTFRMMDKAVNIEKKTLAELQEMNIDNGAKIDDYENLKICTFEEYLQICKDNNMTAVIELKGKNNTEHYDEIIKLVTEYGVEYQFISFHLENLIKLRELTDAPLFYLVQKISQESIDEALSIENCGISFNGNKGKNFDADESGKNMVAKCIDAGLPVAAWTIDTPEALDRLVENGVTTITTNTISY